MPTMHRSPALFVLLLVAAATNAGQLVPAHAAGRSCIGRERDALLAFKQGINDTGHVLESWQHGHQDCCRWAGITCSNTTGHVIQLDLGSGYYPEYPLFGEISSSLLSLEDLEYLNLNFTALTGPNGGVPEFLGSFKNMRHLDLSFMNFSGTLVPPQLGNLSKLEYLDLSYFSYPDCSLYSTDISWLTRLPQLVYLDMSGTNLSSITSDWPLVVNRLPSLEHLGLFDCSLSSANGSITRLNLTNLQHLDLSFMNFSGTLVPPQFGNLSKLEYLDFSYTGMYSTDISWLTRLPQLVYLDMSGTNLSSITSDWPRVVNRLPSLEHLRLLECSLPSANQPLTHLNLTNLQYLDLSYNYFGHAIASAWFWNITSIKRLDLVETSLYGPFPNALANMTSLRDLSFGCYPSFDYSSTTTCNMATMAVDLRKLCDLEFLFLSKSLSSGNITEFQEKLPRCPSNRLRYLNLGSNNMVGIMSDGLGQLTSLTILDLSYNNIIGSIPLSLGNLSHLDTLDLSYNNIIGSIPLSLGNLSHLDILDLSYNNIIGSIPLSLGNLSHLEFLDLSNNHLTSPIPPELGNCTSLRYIRLSNNNLTAPVPLGITSGTRIESLDLSNNSITGVIPLGIGTCTRLDYLALSDNHFTGPIPPWLGNCTNLRSLYLSGNHFTGPIPLEIASCTKLWYLSLSNNLLTGHVPSKIWMLINLMELDLSNNNLDGVIPEEHLVTLNSLTHMDLSNNSFSGPLPSGYGAPRLIELSLSFNYFTGHIPESICCKLWSLLVLDLSDNFLEGELPHCSHKPNLVFLHLSHNRFSGKFPSALQNYSSLAFLDLSTNNFYGTLPLWIGDLVYLRFLQLSHNLLSGDIPVSMTNLKRLRQLSLAGNGMSGVLPWSLSNLKAMAEKHPKRPGVDMSVWYTIMVGKFREVWPVVMKRQELKYGSRIFDVVGIDLSLNQLVGGIPDGITSLNGLLNLNLSWNHLSGNIPANVGAMKSIESLDLSGNNLSGQIPSSLSDLTYLISLDLSYNNLEGRIPAGAQLDTIYTQNPSIYAGNIGLCGPPLERNCSGDSTIEHGNQQRREKLSEPVLFLYFGIGSGFLAGLWVVFCTLLFKKAWRIAYFHLLDKVYDNAYVFAVVTWGKINSKTTN